MRGKREMLYAGKKVQTVFMPLAVMLAVFLSLLLWTGEARTDATTYTVTNTNDSGAGSLREAILAANANAGTDIIEFDIPGSGAQAIAPASSLPDITGQVTIDGYTQSGSSYASGAIPATLMITVQGGSAGEDAGGLVFAAGSDGSVVRGLAVNDFDGDGLSVQASGVSVTGNHIGINAGGDSVVPNGGNGVSVSGSSATIGGTASAERNVISGNGGYGICLNGGSGSTISGNFIGLDATGHYDLGNWEEGIYIDSSTGNTVGGSTATERNVISGNGTPTNGSSGILINGGSANYIRGNYIGTDHDGLSDVGNSSNGMQVDSSTGNTIGGDIAAERNVISGNGGGGILINGGSANQVQGNYIGTNAAGTSDMGNGYYGITANFSAGNVIGGSTAAERNLISGNGGGVYLTNASGGNYLYGNYIGTSVTGTAALGNNGNGIFVEGGDGNSIGGAVAGQGNVISGNGGCGVSVSNGSGNVISGNRIGTDAAATLVLGNGSDGVLLENGSTGNTVGGDTAAERNVISGNGQHGIHISYGSGNNVSGNYIGTDAAGTGDLGNGASGVSLSGSTGNVIGGGTAAERNLISGNGQHGIYLGSSPASTVRGNYIGTDAAGTGNLGNTLYGIYCFTATATDIVGNRIWNNYADGVILANEYSYGVRISANSIYDNDGDGINLMDVAGNDGNNNDITRANRGYDYPVFSAPVFFNSGGAVSVNGTAPPNARVELYYTGPMADPSGYGEGLTYLKTVTAGTSGAFSATLTGLANGDHLSALAISPAGDPSGEGNTSEFAANSLIEAEKAHTWYLAEGSTDWGFDCYISIENPNAEVVNVALTYMTGNGAVTGPTVSMPAMSQATVFPATTLGAADFSTRVECLEGKAISVDRTMSWTGPGAACPEAHCVTGVTAPADTWYMPEGSANWGFECFVLIQNPNDSAAGCQVTWMIEGESPQQTDVTVGASSRLTLNMGDIIGARDASIKVSSDKKIICERAMYRNGRREGHDSTGTPTSAADYYLAEGCTGFGFTTYILVQNPNDAATDVKITYQAATGPVDGPTLAMTANSRVTVCVNDTTVIPGPDPSFSTHVHGSAPIIAERAMYWNGGPDGGQVCHDSIGLDQPHTSWYLADGQTSDGRETWTLVQNPNDSDVDVVIVYMTPDGIGDISKTETITAGSRKSFNMADHSGIAGRAAIMVKCTTAGKKIMVERAMYWNSRGTGTDTIGGYSD